MERTFYLLAYDIANPKRLAKVAKAMEAVGERVQDSVFEAWLSAADVDAVLKKVKKIMNEKEDSLRMYVLCAACREKVSCVGQGKVTPPPGLVII
jgi:CRISPR-associated protein Cas2